MDRTHIINEIKKIQHQPDGTDRAELFVQNISNPILDHADRRSSLNADFQRSVIYIFMLFTKNHYLPKAHWEYLRPNKRSIGMAIVLFVLLIIQASVYKELIGFDGLDGYGGIGFLFLLILEFMLLVWISIQIESRSDSDRMGLLKKCVKCRCNLIGLDSVLGDPIWVGPEVCPECGQEYPAIPE